MRCLVDEWFVTEILPFERALDRYLRRACGHPADVEDLRQEIYARVYEAACGRLPAAAAPFLFAVARNLLIDRVRRSRIVSIDLMADLNALNVLSDEIPADRVLSGRQELARLQEAMFALPARCREVFVLRKIEGLSQREAAERLGIAQSTVEKQVAKAMRLLAAGYFGGGGSGADEPGLGENDEAGGANRG